MSGAFAANYRAIVLPQLRNLCKAEAACIQADVETFPGAWAVVMDHARILGCNFLPDDVIEDLMDWVSNTLLLEIQALESVILPNAA